MRKTGGRSLSREPFFFEQGQQEKNERKEARALLREE